MSASLSKYPIAPELEIPDSLRLSWQKTVNLMAELFHVPAGLIMRVHPREIEVFITSQTPDNCYPAGAREHLDSGLYCERVMDTRQELLVPNALKDPEWQHNPDIKVGMISYCGLPLCWPDGGLFGTICVLSREENDYGGLYRQLLLQFRDSVQQGMHTLYDNIRLQETQEELEQHKLQLTHTLDSLKKTQEELIHTETLAALGAMVAGISHELNTPIGNALIATTALQEQTRQLAAQLGARDYPSHHAGGVCARQPGDERAGPAGHHPVGQADQQLQAGGHRADLGEPAQLRSQASHRRQPGQPQSRPRV